MAQKNQGTDEREMFLHDVAQLASLPAHVTAEAAATAVMCTLSERLTTGETHDVLTSLPVAIGLLFQRSFEERKGPVSRFDRAELLLRVADRLGATPAHAEVICRAVFRAIQAWMPTTEIEHVTRQLPRDMRDLWRLTQVPISDLATVSGGVARQEVLADIEDRASLPEEITSADAFSAVMCTFAQRMSGGEARDVLLSLPDTLRPLVTHCLAHRGEPATPFDGPQFFERLGEHLGTTPLVAEQIARAVFAAVKRILPDKEVGDVASQLPWELRDLWVSS